MDSLLSSWNTKYRESRTAMDSKWIIRRREHLLHVCLNSVGCRFRNSGSCTMCDYGQGNNISIADIRELIEQIEPMLMVGDSVLVGSLGSVLDEDEVSRECLEKLLYFLGETNAQSIILETHYTTLNADVCSWLRECLQKKDIVIEIGLESVDSYVQEKCLNKTIDCDLLKKKIELLHKYDFSVTANVFLGAPFLYAGAQILDAEKTILWSKENDIDSVVIFPANIRKNTLLDFLYRNGKYEPIQQWAVFDLLNRVPVSYLDRIYLSWYGDWFDYDESGIANNLPPVACDACTNSWREFYHVFLACHSAKERKQILAQYDDILSQKCDCKQHFYVAVNNAPGDDSHRNVDKLRVWLADQLYK